jgi:FAD/FMN-containing dehydrogenase
VKYCASHDIPFLAQNGGAGWSTTFHLNNHGVLINLAGLNQVTFSADKTQATIGGGSNISNTIAHAYAAGALVETGNCNCVGTLGAILGGGYGNLLGLYGFGVDNVLSLRVVTPDGRLRDVSAASDPDLFWALRGAGPNFGIVTSAVVKAYPASEDDMQAWTGSLVFTPDQLEDVVEAIGELELLPNMTIFMYFLSDGTEPVVVASPFLYKGDAESGRAAYASLYAIGPVADTTSVLPYNQWNSGGDPLCVPGARKPTWSAGFQDMVPATWRQIWDMYVEFQQQPGAESSGVLLEAYSLTKARSEDPNSAAFPNRHINFNAFVVPWYNDTSLDSDAEAFGSAARELWRSTSGLDRDATYVSILLSGLTVCSGAALLTLFSYVNFAHGDEPLDVVYGESLHRLQSIKRRVDPDDLFNQWFNIK